MKPVPLDIVIAGLSITSSWGNGHATTYRCLLRGLAQRGHRLLFLERDVPWYARQRDLRTAPYADIQLYGGMEELRDRFGDAIEQADLVIVGSFVPQGIEVAKWVLERRRGITAFYDIDTPVTLEQMDFGKCQYLSRELIPRYDLYLSFTGGPVLSHLEQDCGAQLARPLYCAVDPDDYFPVEATKRWDLAFMGTYSADRQPSLERLLMETARRAGDLRFAVAGSLFPRDIAWPGNVDRMDHVPPGDHRSFYNSQRYTLNLTRPQMIRTGHSPSVRLFEAAACGTPILSDSWPGLEELFVAGREVLVVQSADQVLRALRVIPEEQRQAIAEKARIVTLTHHTGLHRAEQLETYFAEAISSTARRRRIFA